MRYSWRPPFRKRSVGDPARADAVAVGIDVGDGQLAAGIALRDGARERERQQQGIALGERVAPQAQGESGDLTRMGILKYNNHSGYIASVINEFDLMAVKTYDAGFYKRLKEPGDPVYHGELIAQILDPCEGTVKSEIISQTDGIVFFAHTGPTVMGNQVVYKIIRRMHE